MPAGMFDSPKQPQLEVPTSQSGFATSAGISSPGFGGSQQSAGANMDSVFADLVHDQEEGAEGAGDARSQQDAAARPTTETETQAADTNADSQQDDSQQKEEPKYPAPPSEAQES
jgi:histone demethylase JARID1